MRSEGGSTPSLPIRKNNLPNTVHADPQLVMVMALSDAENSAVEPLATCIVSPSGTHTHTHTDTRVLACYTWCSLSLSLSSHLSTLCLFLSPSAFLLLSFPLHATYMVSKVHQLPSDTSPHPFHPLHTPAPPVCALTRPFVLFSQLSLPFSCIPFTSFCFDSLLSLCASKYLAHTSARASTATTHDSLFLYPQHRTPVFITPLASPLTAVVNEISDAVRHQEVAAVGAAGVRFPRSSPSLHRTRCRMHQVVSGLPGVSRHILLRSMHQLELRH